jgi:DNA-directed RNA polymerase specialized sigma subunit
MGLLLGLIVRFYWDLQGFKPRNAGNVGESHDWTVVLMENIPNSNDLALAFANGKGRAREKAGRALLERYDKVIEAIIRDEAARSGVHVASLQERAEVRDELRVSLFEAAVSFNPEKSLSTDGNGFDHWVRYCIHNKLSSLAGEEHSVEMPESWQRVARISSKVEEKFVQDNHRAPSFKELQDGVLEHAKKWAKERLEENNSTLTGAALDSAVLEKLRKQGTLGAIENLEDIVILRGRMNAIEPEFDPVQEEDEGSPVSGIFSMLNEEERFIVEHRMGMYDGNEWTFEEIAAELGKPWPEVRKTLSIALTKPRAPHAQYVYLAGIDPQIDEEGTKTAVERLRARSVQR